MPKEKQTRFNVRMTLLLIAGTILFLICSFTVVHAETLTCGWDEWPPYLFKNDQNKITGLDVDLLNAVAKAAGYQIEYHKMTWKRHLHEVEAGKIDIATTASKTPEREKYALFSDEYRVEKAVLFVRNGEVGKFNLSKLDDIVGSKFKLGVNSGYWYGKTFEQLNKDPQFKKHVIDTHLITNNPDMLVYKRIDGYLADYFAGLTIIKEKGLKDKITIHPMLIYQDYVYFMFSKKSVPSATLEKFNSALTRIKQNGEYDRVINKYLN